MHPLLTRVGTLVIAVATVSGLIAAGHQDVTKGRLERSLNATFTHLYVQQAAVLGHRNVTAASLVTTTTTCDRGGPTVKDVGAGPDWVCHVRWTDDAGAKQDGKFELAAKANYCYVASGPSKIVGLITIADSHGHSVLNPRFEFDACYDPGA